MITTLWPDARSKSLMGPSSTPVNTLALNNLISAAPATSGNNAQTANRPASTADRDDITRSLLQAHAANCRRMISDGDHAVDVLVIRQHCVRPSKRRALEGKDFLRGSLTCSEHDRDRSVEHRGGQGHQDDEHRFSD